MLRGKRSYPQCNAYVPPLNLSLAVEKPYSCETCGKSFTALISKEHCDHVWILTQLYTLVVLMHTTEKPYLYETCGKLSAFHHQDCTLERSRCKLTTSSCISPTIYLFVYYHITERINNGPFQDHHQDCTLERLRCIITSGF